MLFYVEYGCDCERVEQVVEASSREHAEEWAQTAAFDSYWSFDIQPDPEEYESNEEWTEACEEDCENNVFWLVETYSSNNWGHIYARIENGIYEI